ncbi:MAG: type II secretion system minor pseudopilin GspH [Pseudomonadales bacterium]|nr:type II secretion system minor pseudopilin GspH [Pseudomonadales bacterium]
MQSRGFTLLEVLMVVLIVGIMTAVVVLSVNFDGGSQGLQNAAEHISDQLARFEDESIGREEVWGVEVKGVSLRFWRLDTEQGRWVKTQRPWLPAEYDLPSGMSVSLVQDATSSPVKSQYDPLSDTIQPDIYFMPTGAVTPAELELHEGDLVRYVRLDALGRLSVLEHPYAPQP